MGARGTQPASKANRSVSSIVHIGRSGSILTEFGITDAHTPSVPEWMRFLLYCYYLIERKRLVDPAWRSAECFGYSLHVPGISSHTPFAALRRRPAMALTKVHFLRSCFYARTLSGDAPPQLSTLQLEALDRRQQTNLVTSSGLRRDREPPLVMVSVVAGQGFRRYRISRSAGATKSKYSQFDLPGFFGPVLA